MKFLRKTAIITGAGSGIGKATAFELAETGCNLALVSLDLENLQKVKEELKKLPNRIEIYQTDVSNLGQIEEAFQKIGADFVQIDYLVNNAGYNSSKPLKELSEADFDREIAVSLKGTYLCTKEVYPLMKNGGAVVNLASIRGRTGTPTSSPAYAAAKAGVINLTKTFALQLAKDNIRVNCVAPGIVYPTGLTQNYSPQKREAIRKEIPLGRLGNPQDIANAILFLLSSQASYITGQTLDVNGGSWLN